MNDTIPARARRRGYLVNLRKKARLRAERQYREQFLVHRSTQHRCSFDYFYSYAMLAQGKYFNGGCKVPRCGLCDYFTPSYRMIKQHDQFDREYKDWLNGNFLDPAE